MSLALYGDQGDKNANQGRAKCVFGPFAGSAIYPVRGTSAAPKPT
jgi:hypothetical protein